MLKNILVATDFSGPSRAALFAGVSLAKRSLGHIEVVHVVTPWEEIYNFSRYGIPDYQWKIELQKHLDDFFPQKLYPNSNRQIIVGRSVSEEILKFARTHGSELIILGFHGRDAVSNLLLGSLSQKISHVSEIPVMLVHDVRHANQPYQGFDRILVPTDFSDTSMNALAFGIRFTNFLKADLHLIHVVDTWTIAELQPAYQAGHSTIPATCELNVDSTLLRMVDKKELVADFCVSTLFGDPATEIVTYAEEKRADFIIMGNHGRKGLERMVLGSVTASVIAKSLVPVITMSHAQTRDSNFS